MKYATCALSLILLSLPALAQTDTAPAAAAAAVSASDTAPAALETAPTQVVVEGRRPGPGVWKVSKGDHVMYVFGMYAPLPNKLEWDDTRVERLVRNSQEVLLPPKVSFSLSGAGGFFKGLAALPSLIGLDKNPDGATMHDLLSADDYERWRVLKAKYLGADNDLERLRPILVAEKLMEAGLRQNGLTGNDDIYGRIVDIAKKYRVKETPTGVNKVVENPRQLLRDIKATQFEDLACFTKTLDGIEGDIAAMHIRANAWANGNIAEINRLDFAERDAACRGAVLNSAAVSKMPGFENLVEQSRQNWIESAERALANNTQTFAMLQMKNILGADSVLAVLQAKGYTVESPK